MALPTFSLVKSSALPFPVKFPSARHSQFELNAAILLASSLGASALGFIYWAVAERQFSTEAVGRASTIVIAATMLGTVGTLGLGSMLERFVSSCGDRARRAVWGTAAIVGSTSLVLGLLFATFMPVADTLFLSDWERPVFGLVAATFGLYAIADPILVGLRRAAYVALKNLGVATLKLLALFPLAGVGAVGIYLSWASISLLAAIVAICWAALFWVRDTMRRKPSLPARATLLAHHRAVFSLLIVGSLTPAVVPLIVAQRLGLEDAAYFNIAAVIVTAVAMLDHAIASSYMAEASHPDIDTAATTRRLIKMKLLAGLATVVGLSTVGPLMLSLVGPGYAEGAGTYLRLMAFALLAQFAINFYAQLARIESRLGLLTKVQVISVILLLTGSWYAVDLWGITGIGFVYLAVEIVCFLLILGPCIAALRRVLAIPHTPSVA